jgi:hypothetical protein
LGGVAAARYLDDRASVIAFSVLLLPAAYVCGIDDVRNVLDSVLEGYEVGSGGITVLQNAITIDVLAIFVAAALCTSTAFFSRAISRRCEIGVLSGFVVGTAAAAAGIVDMGVLLGVLTGGALAIVVPGATATAAIASSRIDDIATVD